MDINDVVGFFTKSIPQSIETKNTSHGDDDFRETLLVDFDMKRLWSNFPQADTDNTKIQKHLDAIEYEQTRDIDFISHM